MTARRDPDQPGGDRSPLTSGPSRLLRTLAIRVPWPHVIVFFAAAGLVVGFISYHLRSERRHAVEQWRSRLSVIADERARQVDGWLEARRIEAAAAAALAPVRALLAGGSATGGDARQAVVAQLDRLTQAQRHRAIWITDQDGLVVARSTGAGDLPPMATDLALAAIRAGGVRVALLRAPGKLDDLGLAVPVGGDAGARPAGASRSPSGAVVLRVSPAQSLFPLVTTETVATRTGEMLLFQVDGSEARYLSPFRHDAVGRAALQRSRQQLASHARAVPGGRSGFVEMTDHRDVPTFAALRWLAPVGWGLALKIDRSEALGDFYRAATMAWLAGAFLTLAVAALLVGIVRQRERAALVDAGRREERALWHLKSYVETVLATVPSGLIVLSADLRIVSANRAFLQDFGLGPDEVLGKRLDDTLHAEGLLPRLREALDTGVAEHELVVDVVVLSRRQSRPARITMTGLRSAEDDDGRLLLVVQDLSEHTRAEETLRRHDDQPGQTPKAVAVGPRAGDIAHDLNNALMVILGASDVIRRRLPGGHPLHRHAEGIQTAAQEAVSLIGPLRAVTEDAVTGWWPMIDGDGDSCEVAESPDVARTAGQDTILLVEDTDRVRDVVREILEQHGYRVLEARDGHEALAIARQHEGPISLLVADVVMPRMSGRELARHLAVLRPQTRVVYMSGYPDKSMVGHGGRKGGTAVIAKPFTPDALAVKVREVLEAAPELEGAAATADGHQSPLAARR